MSSKYNGFWNAEEIMKKSLMSLSAQHQADYSEILEVYPYVDVENASTVSEDMDNVMKKMARLVKLHPKSDWIDDTYVMLGRAQYLKQDYETAEETFKYFEEEFNPNNPKGRLYFKEKNKKGSAEEKKKKKEAEKKKNRKIKEENMKKAKKEKAAEREEKQDLKAERKKKIDRFKKDIKKLKDDLREATKKRKEQEKKAREKARKKKQRIKKDPNGDPRSQKEKEIEAKIEAKEKLYQAYLNPPEVKKQEVASTEEETQDNEKEEEEELAKRKKLPKKKISHDDPKGLFKGKLAFHEGVYWLARTYTEQKNYFAAEYLLKQLENEYPTRKEVLEMVPAARAHLLMRQKDYSNAVPFLERAIENEKSKVLKARYAYIIGQIHQLEGNKNAASMAFKKVSKYKPSYELRFNAELNLAKASWASGQSSKSGAINTLRKMLKDRKNEDYQDQIYFTIGNIHEEDGNVEEAIASYQSSVFKSTINKKQKLESYYRIANLLFDQERYVEASAYYDSTLTNISKEDERYFEVKDYAGSLKDIASNIQTIEFQDSLLYLSTLSNEELEKKLGAIVDERLEAQKNGEEDTSSGNKDFIDRKNGFGGSQSSFFAYDETLVLAGQRIFERKWGLRSLSDDWRRSNRIGAIDVEIEEVEEVDNDAEREAALLALMASVPTTPIKKAKAHELRSNAMFDLGLLFKNKLNHNQKSIESLTALLKNYPGTEKEAEALFYLYISHQDLGNLAEAAKYKKILIEKYPNAKFSQSLTNLNFAAEQNRDKNKEQLFYTETYSHFENGSHQEVLNRIEKAKSELTKTHPLMPKYALLQAMSLGNVNGKEAYIKALQELIARYPNTGEEARAKEILRFIRGDKKAFDSRLYDEVSEDFSLDDDKLHYVIIVLYDDKQKSLQDVKIKISDYNKKYHQLEKLRISDLPLNREEGTQLVLIRKFRNKAKAMKYFEGTKKNAADFLDSNKVGFDIFATTQKNYREIAKKKGVLEYRAFFEKNYLGN